MKGYNYKRFKIVCFVVLLVLVAAGISTTGCRQAQPSGRVTAPIKNGPTLDARQASEFISYNNSVSLNATQQKIMDEALSSMPAPCCAKNSMKTCCCPCNLAKTAWGLSKHLIAEQNYTAPEVKEAIAEWLRVTNPSGYTGNACYTGGCNRAFANNGCGGMDGSKLISAQ